MLKAVLIAMIALPSVGCSLRTLAVNQVGNAIAAGGSTFASDDDPQLVGDALPFSLKFMEALLAESPEHQALLVATARGFTQYAYGWVAPAADETNDTGGRARSARLYLRARDYGLRALSASIPGIRSRFGSDPKAAVAVARRRDVPALYWTACAWGLAISANREDPEMLADLPAVDALISRAAELDPSYDDGAIDAFLVTWEATRSGVSKEAEKRAREHFDRAVRLSAGHSAEPFVAAAEALAVPAQDRREFEALLRRAMDVSLDARPERRLANIISQRRAAWLLVHADDLFVEPAHQEDSDEP